MKPAESSPMNDLAVEIREVNQANGWNVIGVDGWDDTYRVSGILALIHSEVSEALEAFRIGDPANFAEELADVVIRVLDLAGGLGIDMDREVHRKLAKNRMREHRHGGKRL